VGPTRQTLTSHLKHVSFFLSFLPFSFHNRSSSSFSSLFTISITTTSLHFPSQTLTPFPNSFTIHHIHITKPLNRHSLLKHYDPFFPFFAKHNPWGSNFLLIHRVWLLETGALITWESSLRMTRSGQVSKSYPNARSRRRGMPTKLVSEP